MTALLMGAVAYDPKVVTIWDGLPRLVPRPGPRLRLRPLLQLRAPGRGPVAGHIHVAWNSPLAWVAAAPARRRRCGPLAMRDTDCDLTSVVVVRADSGIDVVADLAGRTVAVGAVDSPQATLIPLAHLRAAWARPSFDVRRFDVGVGKHGDHIGGERDAARALMAGEVDAACMIDANHLLFVARGHAARRVRPGSLAQTPPYDHCNMTVVDAAPDGARRPVRRAAAGDVLRRPGGAAAARPGGPEGVAAGPDQRVRRAGARRSTRPGSTTPRAASPPPTTAAMTGRPLDLDGARLRARAPTSC